MDENSSTTNEDVKNEDSEVIDTSNSNENNSNDNSADNSNDNSADNSDASIMDVLASIKEEQASLRAQLISIKDSMAQFVDAGGTIQEGDNIQPIDDDTPEYIPIEELDLSI